ncbi:MAG: DUF1874 domain-containing protein [Candidatus Hadarchaeales archaeon]|nr:MAG: hypothetical protein DSO03_03245 [Hadesarchaea archaeon]
MTRYLFNSLVLPVDFEREERARFLLERIGEEEVRKGLKEGFVSAIGHEATARLLSELFGVEVPVQRREVRLKIGDEGIHFCLKKRLSEGEVITSKEELAEIGYFFVRSRRIE